MILARISIKDVKETVTILLLTSKYFYCTVNTPTNRSVKTMVYGYARCSTNETLQDIDRQKRELWALGVPKDNIYCEYESGRKADRIELKRLFDAVKPGDVIITTEVSRLTRSTKQLCDIIDFAKNKKLKLSIGSFIVDCRNDELDPMTDGMLKMMGVFAEMESAMIQQRVKSGMANAKAKGAIIGRPKTALENLPSIFIKHYPKYLAKDVTQEEFARLCDVSRQSISKYIRIYNQHGKHA
jgi:DNA invertase Pin-like site-specific DNA recombinase